MLEELRLSSVGGIAHAALKFGAGLIAVTGESGAGKSSLVRGLEMVCGKRSSSSTIRAGDETAIADACFFCDEPLAGLDADLQPQDGLLLFRRELSHTGRSRCAIQGHTVPLNAVFNAAPRLITIQSQFAQLELLEPERQLEMLDICGGEALKATRERLEKQFYHVLECEKKIRQNKQREKDVTDRYASLSIITPYLEKAGLQEDSEDRLEEEYLENQQSVKHFRELRSRMQMLQNAEGGLIEELRSVFENLEDLLPSEHREAVMEKAQSAMDALSETADMLSDLAPSEKIAELEENLESVESTMGRIRKCKRLARVSTVADLLEYWKKGEEEMKWLGEAPAIQAELKEKAAQAKRDVAQEARILMEQRLAAAAELEARVTKNLADLAMENTQFRIRVTETTKLRSNGAEKVDFVLLRGGQEIPVAKAASGGELSRILLAIQISLPEALMPATIVFDEVEAGLGGRAAYLTGLKLRDLANRVQVILITHEANIAALANQHYIVERTGTLSSVREISGEERVQEIARMLSGDVGKEEALVHARRLLGAQIPAEEIIFNPEDLQ